MMGGNRVSHIPAHESAATVAPFRAWRGLQLIVARGPTRQPLQNSTLLIERSGIIREII